MEYLSDRIAENTVIPVVDVLSYALANTMFFWWEKTPASERNVNRISQERSAMVENLILKRNVRQENIDKVLRVARLGFEQADRHFRFMVINQSIGGEAHVENVYRLFFLRGSVPAGQYNIVEEWEQESWFLAISVALHLSILLDSEHCKKDEGSARALLEAMWDDTVNVVKQSDVGSLVDGGNIRVSDILANKNWEKYKDFIAMSSITTMQLAELSQIVKEHPQTLPFWLYNPMLFYLFIQFGVFYNVLAKELFGIT